MLCFKVGIVQLAHALGVEVYGALVVWLRGVVIFIGRGSEIGQTTQCHCSHNKNIFLLLLLKYY